MFADDKVLSLARLRLVIHTGTYPRPVAEGFPFLGFVTFPNRRRLKRRRGVHFARRLVAMSRMRREGQLPQAAVTASIRGWVNHVRFGNTVGLRKAVLRGLGG